jgi:hypothetical protein
MKSASPTDGFDKEALKDTPPGGYNSSIRSQVQTPIEITLSEDMYDIGVTKMIKDENILQIWLDRGNKIILVNIDKRDVNKTTKSLRDSAVKGAAEVSPETVRKLEQYLTDPDRGYYQYIRPIAKKSRTSLTSSKDGEEGEEATYTNAAVYELDSKLYESIFIGKIACFLEIEDPYNVQQQPPSLPAGGVATVGKSTATKNIYKKDKVNKSTTTLVQPQEINVRAEILSFVDNTIIYPLDKNDYRSLPYEFKSREELDRTIARVRTYRTVEPLYYAIKKMWSLYTTYGTNHKSICSSDVVFTYFQDRLGMTHYDIFGGDNGW